MIVEHKNNFNLLRFVFAAMVLLSHAPELIDGNRRRELLTMAFHTMSFGEFAVGGFFLLSGYLITKSWCNNRDPVAYLGKRIKRIFPAFLVASFISVLIVGPLGAASAHSYFANLDVANFLTGLLWLDIPFTPPVFDGRSYGLVNGAMWSISVEFCCYLGVLCLGVIGATRRSTWLALTVFVFLTALLQRFGFDPLNIARFHPTLAAYFGVGGCFFFFREKIRFTRMGMMIALIALATGLFSWRGHVLPFALAGGYLIFYLAQARIDAVKGFNRYPDISYGLYLYGWPIQKLLIYWFPEISPMILFLVSLLAAGAAGYASWKLIEERFVEPRRAPLLQPAI